MCRVYASKTAREAVLILVVVEYALCALSKTPLCHPRRGLNPCCCGVCSMWLFLMLIGMKEELS